MDALWEVVAEQAREYGIAILVLVAVGLDLRRELRACQNKADKVMSDFISYLRERAGKD